MLSAHRWPLVHPDPGSAEQSLPRLEAKLAQKIKDHTAYCAISAPDVRVFNIDVFVIIFIRYFGKNAGHNTKKTYRQPCCLGHNYYNSTL
jgi:hypothetical protein